VENFVENVDNINTDEKTGKKKNLMLVSQNATLDDKGRINIPAKFRSALDEGFRILKHTDDSIKCLLIFTESRWERFHDKLNEKPTIAYTKALRFLQVSEITPKQGRFVVPPMLREYAQLKEELIIIGMGEMAEVWSKSEYEKCNSDDIGDILKDV
jgi:MraZ protein